jgi:tRNA dimethylallyltransferase
MDIGTAKPTPEQQALVPHHLLDIVTPDDNLGLAQYQKLAYVAIEAISERGNIPLLVGGTGQYITAIVEGWSIPEVKPNDALRTELEAFASEYGSEALHKRLHELDSTAAGNIDHRNVRRVVRALEVCIETGQPMSELQQKQLPPYSIITYGLTLDRETLYERADHRVDLMMETGFVGEVQKLLDQSYSRKLPSMSGLGYAQLAAHLSGDTSLEEAVTLTKHATHDFIRRQYTWFRGHDSGILWHNIQDVNRAALIESVTRWLHERD